MTYVEYDCDALVKATRKAAEQAVRGNKLKHPGIGRDHAPLQSRLEWLHLPGRLKPPISHLTSAYTQMCFLQSPKDIGLRAPTFGIL